MLHRFYRLARSVLFQLDAEKAHDLTLESLACMSGSTARVLINPGVPSKPVEVMGIRFDNPVGLSAGLDKNAVAIDAFDGMGFGFVEVGTITPLGQPGNPKPRMFRIPQKQAIINRLGFNNRGVDNLIENVKKSSYKGVLGINIGKNKDTPVERAVDDYLICMNKVYAHADYITVNISSPNTPGLRGLQEGEALEGLLAGVKQAQARMTEETGRYVPVAVKVAPDLDDEQIAEIARVVLNVKMDGLIATNTTITRDAVQGLKHADEQGGLSGAPVAQRSTEVIAAFHKILKDDVPIIGVGGICSAEDALAKRDAGAKLVQIYSGFIYRGPALIKEIVQSW
ncbi:MAG: dihydroorotate dehydrogenase [Pseudoalteromonas tetraodonis]|jgi:dihydroorotate dehydrogenase